MSCGETEVGANSNKDVVGTVRSGFGGDADSGLGGGTYRRGGGGDGWDGNKNG